MNSRWTVPWEWISIANAFETRSQKFINKIRNLKRIENKSQTYKCTERTDQTDQTIIKWIQRKCNMYRKSMCDSRTIYFLTLNFHIANFLRCRCCCCCCCRCLRYLVIILRCTWTYYDSLCYCCCCCCLIINIFLCFVSMGMFELTWS